MPDHRVPLGQRRTDADGCRRYRPIGVTFDTRSVVLGMEIEEHWTAEIKQMWADNQTAVAAGLLAQLGPEDGEAKLENYRLMGPEPWSVVFEHNVLLRQVRASFAHGDFYPALVGACALGERLLHQLVHALREDYVNHQASTRRVRTGNLPNDWGALIDVLHGWGVLDDEAAVLYRQLEQQRHASVHFNRDLLPARREPALEALQAIQRIIEAVLAPHGGPPRWIANTPGNSYLGLQAEAEPIVQRIFIPRCALVSPGHRLQYHENGAPEWLAFDDLDRRCEPLSDEQFAQRLADEEQRRARCASKDEATSTSP